jgi:hypothetical protein
MEWVNALLAEDTTMLAAGTSYWHPLVPASPVKTNGAIAISVMDFGGWTMGEGFASTTTDTMMLAAGSSSFR